MEIDLLIFHRPPESLNKHIALTRSLSLLPTVVLGFSNQAINIYLPILALQLVFIHCNMNYPLGGLRKVIATPQFHHWHYASAERHLDKNFSTSLPLFDILLRTYYCPRELLSKVVSEMYP